MKMAGNFQAEQNERNDELKTKNERRERTDSEKSSQWKRMIYISTPWKTIKQINK